VRIGDTEYVKGTDGVIRLRDPKVRGKANVKRAKRARQAKARAEGKVGPRG
jgi:hypothetical protein